MKISNRHYLYLLPTVLHPIFQFTRGRDRPTLVYSRPSLAFFLGGSPTLVLALGEVQLPFPVLNGPSYRKELNPTKPKPNPHWFVASRGEDSESESKSPGVVTKSQESESESIKLLRLRLRLRPVHHNLAQFGVGQNIFCFNFREYCHFLTFRASIGATMKDHNLKLFR